MGTQVPYGIMVLPVPRLPQQMIIPEGYKVVMVSDGFNCWEKSDKISKTV